MRRHERFGTALIGALVARMVTETTTEENAAILHELRPDREFAGIEKLK